METELNGERVDRACELYKKDPAKGFEEFRNLSEIGSVRAMSYVAYAFATGMGTAVNLQEANRWHTRAAELGSVESMAQVANAFATGKGSQVNLPEAIRWYQRAHQGGHRRASIYLGALLLKLKKYNEAEEIFSGNAERNDATFMYWLARVYIARGDQLNKARELLENAMASGALYAQASLARLLMRGKFGWKGVIRGIWLWASGLALTLYEFRRGKPAENPRLQWW